MCCVDEEDGGGTEEEAGKEGAGLQLTHDGSSEERQTKTEDGNGKEVNYGDY